MNTDEKANIKLSEAANIVYLSGENCTFFQNSDFLGAKMIKNGETTEHKRVWLHRSLPFDMPWQYISVQDEDGEELGLIKSIEDLSDDQQALIKKELERKYYTPKVERILSVKETRGTSFWKCLTDAGEISFTVQDTFRSISRIGGDRAFVTDACGGRYEIRSISALDKKSRRQLEIYL